MSNIDQAQRTLKLERSEAAPAAQIREIGMLTRALLDAEVALEREQVAHAALRNAMSEYEGAAGNYAEILQSTSWRVTAPMRWAITKMRR